LTKNTLSFVKDETTRTKLQKCFDTSDNERDSKAIERLLDEIKNDDEFWKFLFFAIIDQERSKNPVTLSDLPVVCSGVTVDKTLTELEREIINDYEKDISSQISVPEGVIYPENKQILIDTLKKEWKICVSSFALRNAATATSLTLYKRKHLLQWRVEQQQSVSHHHPEDSHYEDQDHVNPSWSEGIEVKNHYCKIFPSFIFSFLQLKLKFPTPSPDLFDLKSSSLYTVRVVIQRRRRKKQ